jgi:hypothetical protein
VSQRTHPHNLRLPHATQADNFSRACKILVETFFGPYGPIA